MGDNITGHSDDGVSVQINELQFRGFNSSSGISNFLGVPYATTRGRFRQAALIDPHQRNGFVDATKYGPRCPQPVGGSRSLTNYLYTGLETPTSPPESEDACLVLNIYTPPEVLASDEKLPIIVFIHGGGWAVGDGNSDYDGNFLVSHSVKSGSPFIYVALNYRLGYFGFLSSKELKAEAQSLGEIGFANQGLYDQRLGLQWVHNNIHFFGGDKSRVTLAGESAGAWSVLAHLRSDFPACQHAFIMSCPSLPMHSPEAGQETFDRLVKSSGIPFSASAADKLSSLRNITPEQLVALLPGSYTLPIWDSEWFIGLNSALPLEHVAHFPSWVKTVTIGSMKDEGAAFRPLFASWSIEDIQKAIRVSIPDEDFAQEIIDAYGLGADTDRTSTLSSLCQLYTDTLFATVPSLVASKSLTPVTVFSFEQTDDFEASLFKGYSYHAFDNVFFCRLPAVAGDDAPAAMRATADAFSSSIADVIYGKQPWEIYTTSKRVMRFDGNKSGLVNPSGLDKWKPFMSSVEREKKFKLLGKALAIYNPNASSQPPI